MLRPDAILFGDDDQAWLYREAMRGVWLQTPAALEWLKIALKALHIVIPLSLNRTLV